MNLHYVYHYSNYNNNYINNTGKHIQNAAYLLANKLRTAGTCVHTFILGALDLNFP